MPWYYLLAVNTCCFLGSVVLDTLLMGLRLLRLAAHFALLASYMLAGFWIFAVLFRAIFDPALNLSEEFMSNWLFIALPAGMLFILHCLEHIELFCKKHKTQQTYQIHYGHYPA